VAGNHAGACTFVTLFLAFRSPSLALGSGKVGGKRADAADARLVVALSRTA
jgi:hypothetical protein